MKKFLIVIKAEITKQQQHDYHSVYVYFSLLIWPILGFFEVYYAYKPFELTDYMGIEDGKTLLAFLGMPGPWRIRSGEGEHWRSPS